MASHEPFLVDSAKGISSRPPRFKPNRFPRSNCFRPLLRFPDASPRHSGTNVNTVVKAANLERLVDILILGVSDFSSYIHDDDLAKYPEIHPTSNQDSSTTTTLSTPIHPVFRVDMDVHTMTFFATYRSFCSATLLLESFRKRFVGAQSAALSIARHLKSCLVSQDQTSSSSSSSSTGDSTHFPTGIPPVTPTQNLSTGVSLLRSKSASSKLAIFGYPNTFPTFQTILLPATSSWTSSAISK